MTKTTRRKFLTIVAGTSIAVVIGLDETSAKKKGRRRRDRDHDDAWVHSQSGNILPLSKIRQIVRSRIKGEIIETEFDHEDGYPVYEFKYIDRSGRVRELYIDARTGSILKDELD